MSHAPHKNVLLLLHMHHDETCTLWHPKACAICPTPQLEYCLLICIALSTIEHTLCIYTLHATCVCVYMCMHVYMHMYIASMSKHILAVLNWTDTHTCCNSSSPVLIAYWKPFFYINQFVLYTYASADLFTNIRIYADSPSPVHVRRVVPSHRERCCYLPYRLAVTFN